jgi:DNA-binding IclR family transcriptional regulator
MLQSMKNNDQRPAPNPMPRSLTTHKPGRSPANRSLERGVEILRAFRPGSALMGNSELCERTGLSPSTVSRLTQTLVGVGMLELDVHARAYRLAPPVLSFAHAMRSGSAVLQAAAPIMRSVAEKHHINVGLAAPDRDEMVYLESIRYNRRVALRNVVSGQRVPVELTSLGRAYLAIAPDEVRRELMAWFRQRRRAQWSTLASEIQAALDNMRQYGYCAASWQPEVVALSAPLRSPTHPMVINVSVSTTAPLHQIERELAPTLLDMVSRIDKAIVSNAPDTSR